MKGTKLFLLANKSDHFNKQTAEEGQKLAGEKGMKFAEVSAKTGKNVEAVFSELVLNIVKEELAFPRKDIYMTFLLHLEDNFDDDLLMDAMELLTSE